MAKTTGLEEEIENTRLELGLMKSPNSPITLFPYRNELLFLNKTAELHFERIVWKG